MYERAVSAIPSTTFLLIKAALNRCINTLNRSIFEFIV